MVGIAARHGGGGLRGQPTLRVLSGWEEFGLDMGFFPGYVLVVFAANPLRPADRFSQIIEGLRALLFLRAIPTKLSGLLMVRGQAAGVAEAAEAEAQAAAEGGAGGASGDVALAACDVSRPVRDEEASREDRGVGGVAGGTGETGTWRVSVGVSNSLRYRN